MENYNEKEIAEQEEKRVFFIVAILAAIFVLAGAYHAKQEERRHAQNKPQTQVTQTVTPTSTTSAISAEKEKENKEFAEAMYIAQKYIDSQPISENMLYTILTLNYGYSSKVTQLAIRFASVDWKNEAVEKATIYMAIMPMSKNELIGQLVEADLFTREQAEYAVKKFF